MPQIIDTIDPISSAALGAAAPGTAIAAGIGSISLGGAIVGAALGSAASQLTGIALGAQVKFSWRQVAVAGITGAAGATVGQAVSGIGNGATNLLSTTQRLAAQGIFDYSVNYAASKVVGLDTAFSWKNVAGAAISSVIAGNLNTKTDLSGSIIRGIGSAASSAYIRDKWFGGDKPDYAQIAADAFGNALADYLVGTMGKPADKPGSFFQIGSGEPLDSFSYSGNSIDSSATESPFSLDTSELGTYESGPDYSSGAYIADVDTDRYLGQMSTETNPSNPYGNLVDQYSLGIGHPNSLPQSFEAIEGSSGWGFAKRLGQMIPIAGNLLIPTKSIPGEEGSLFEAVRGLIGTDDAIQNKADIEAYESRSPLGVSNEKVATAAEVTLAVTSGIKALPELAKAAEAFKI
ncbi:hypothetical protein [Pseudomonas sp. RIT-PI-S]|uniref:hypothetical protein n=1 Tax=Pseudomonas sp. RIT-PI-S TaxID=3035295 RepID=UPI0021DA194B|nr:hypothetical protein [Pseudomonas sp. RIT-PI-S]